MMIGASMDSVAIVEGEMKEISEAENGGNDQICSRSYQSSNSSSRAFKSQLLFSQLIENIEPEKRRWSYLRKK